MPEHHVLLVIGDMNAKLGKETLDDHRFYFHSQTNRNGSLLRDTLLEINTVIVLSYIPECRTVGLGLKEGRGRIELAE